MLTDLSTVSGHYSAGGAGNRMMSVTCAVPVGQLCLTGEERAVVFNRRGAGGCV